MMNSGLLSKRLEEEPSERAHELQDCPEDSEKSVFGDDPAGRPSVYLHGQDLSGRAGSDGKGVLWPSMP